VGDDQRPEPPEDLRCVELVELITDYLEDALSDDLRARIEAHLDTCPGCTTAIGQLRTVINLTGELTASDVEDLDPLEREALLSTFRRLRRR
jgi:anti-sigma factor RsiW